MIKVIEQPEARRTQARPGVDEKRIAARHAKARLTAPERIGVLVDEDPSEECDIYVTDRTTDFGMDSQKVAGDGVVSGRGTINGRPTYVLSQDFTVLAGSQSETHTKKSPVADGDCENGVGTLEHVRLLFDFLPLNNREKPPVRSFHDDPVRIENRLDRLSASLPTSLRFSPVALISTLHHKCFGMAMRGFMVRVNRRQVPTGSR